LTLFPNRQRVSSHRSIGNGGSDATSNESRNRFECLNDLVPDLIQALDIEDDEEGTLDASPNASKIDALTVSETPTLGDDPLASLIRIHLLLRVSMSRQRYHCSKSNTAAFRN
jgi:hypothetical protein